MLNHALRRVGTLALAWSWLAMAQPQEDDVIDIGDRKQLFLDGAMIADSHGVSLAMNEPYTHPEPVLTADTPWERQAGATVWAYSSLRKEGDTVRLWYELIRLTEGDEETGPRAAGEFIAYAESEDGIHFTKPDLGLHDFFGTRNNALVIPECRGAAVWVDPNAPPEQRYRTQAKGRENKLIFHHSPDGIHWTETQAIALGDCDTQSIAFWDDLVGRYVLYTRTWVRSSNKAENFRYHRRLESDDLVNWDQETPVIKADDIDLAAYASPSRQPAIDYYGACVFRYPDARGLYLMLPQAFWHWYARPKGHQGPDAMDVRLCASRDGKDFSHIGGRAPFLRLGPAGSWYSRMMWVLPEPIVMGDEMWFYFFGSNADHSGLVDPAAADGPQTGIGRAVLRLDGFASVNAGIEWGEVTTPLMRFTGNALELNIDTSAGGCTYVELLDAAARPIAGCTRADAVPVWGNSVRAPVTWQGTPDLGVLAGQPIRLHFYLRDSRLYAFQFHDTARP